MRSGRSRRLSSECRDARHDQTVAVASPAVIPWIPRSQSRFRAIYVRSRRANATEETHTPLQPTAYRFSLNACSAFSKKGTLLLCAAGTFRSTISQFSIALLLSPLAA